jgi:hypothetical protein
MKFLHNVVLLTRIQIRSDKLNNLSIAKILFRSNRNLFKLILSLIFYKGLVWRKNVYAVQKIFASWTESGQGEAESELNNVRSATLIKSKCCVRCGVRPVDLAGSTHRAGGRTTRRRHPRPAYPREALRAASRISGRPIVSCRNQSASQCLDIFRSGS